MIGFLGAMLTMTGIKLFVFGVPLSIFALWEYDTPRTEKIKFIGAIALVSALLFISGLFILSRVA
jgi:hypothetical protein